jgi:peptide deformylase
MLPIITEPNPILRQKAQEIEPDKIKSPEIQRLISDMKETVGPAGGIGLATPQIGLSVRLIVINLENKLLALINPKIIKFSWRKKVGEEGCLSVPGKFGYVKRSKVVKVMSFNESGEKIEFKAKDLFARVVQHEIDHLNGVLFIDKAKKISTENSLHT